VFQIELLAHLLELELIIKSLKDSKLIKDLLYWWNLPLPRTSLQGSHSVWFESSVLRYNRESHDGFFQHRASFRSYIHKQWLLLRSNQRQHHDFSGTSLLVPCIQVYRRSLMRYQGSNISLYRNRLISSTHLLRIQDFPAWYLCGWCLRHVQLLRLVLGNLRRIWFTPLWSDVSEQYDIANHRLAVGPLLDINFLGLRMRSAY